MLQRSKTDFLQIPVGPGKPYYKIQTSRSADVSSSSLPHLKVPNMPDSISGEAGGKNIKAKDPDTTLPALSREKTETKILSPVKETAKEQLPAELSDSASTNISETDSVGSADSDESGYMMAIKAKRQAARKASDATKQGKGMNETLGMPEKHQLNLLDDANLRKDLLQKLDEQRQERVRSNKWGMIKNAFKVTGMLKVKMPDVIKEQAKSKHHNRAIDQVQERIKARQDGGLMHDGNGRGLNRRLSQSMGALDGSKTSTQPVSNQARYN